MMQKYFTKEIAQPFKIVVLGLAIGLGVSFVSANWTAPLSTAPNCTSGDPGCDAPINVSSEAQSKGGPKILGITHNVYGTSAADEIRAFSKFKVGAGTTPVSDGNSEIFGLLDINRSSYTQANDPRGRNMLNLIGGGTVQANDSVGVIQNKPWFFLWDYSSNKRAGIRADGGDFEGAVNVGAGVSQQEQDPLLKVNRGGSTGFVVEPNAQSSTSVDVTVNGRLKINDGTQGPGKVLASVNNTGLSSWGTLTGGGMDVIIVGHTRPNVTNMSQFNTEAYCPDTHPILLSGGSDCQYPFAVRESHPVMPGNARPATGNNSDVSIPETPKSGWTTVCAGPSSASGHDAHAWAVCAKMNPVTVSIAPPSAPATWHYTQPGVNSAVSCYLANGVSSGDVGVVYQTLEAPTSAGPWNFTQPSSFSNVDTTKCPTNATPYTASVSHLPPGQVWTGESTTGVTYSSADQVYIKTKYWLVKRY